jgi:hypothetical protein
VAHPTHLAWSKNFETVGNVFCALDALKKKKGAPYTVQQAHYLVGSLIHDEPYVRIRAKDIHEDAPHDLEERHEAYVVIVSIFSNVPYSLKPLLARRRGQVCRKYSGSNTLSGRARKVSVRPTDLVRRRQGPAGSMAFPPRRGLRLITDPA